MERGGLWPSESDLPGFRAILESFATKSNKIALLMLSCFADALGLPSDYFDSRHDVSLPDSQSTLRLLHYPAVDPNAPLTATPEGKQYYRAGAHTE